MRLLVVEDDPDLADMLRDGLVEAGYAVDLALNGEDGLWRATTIEYDAAVLDVMLPDLSGLDIVRGMRRAGHAAPVLMLTARDDIDDRVAGLDSGADDYVVKPFVWAELLARLRALLRRGPRGAERCLEVGSLRLDPATREVFGGEARIDFTAKEFDILYVLMREPGRVFSRTDVIERVYDDDFDGVSNVIDVFFSRIRRKIADVAGAPSVRTVRGVGYALSVEPAA